jgi:hypothetical protein
MCKIHDHYILSCAYSQDALIALIGMRFGATLKYIELPSELITAPVLHELSNKCPALKAMTLDFSNAMQLHDFNDLNAFPCNLRSLCICLSEVIFLEGFMRRIYSCLSSLEVLHLIGKSFFFYLCTVSRDRKCTLTLSLLSVH